MENFGTLFIVPTPIGNLDDITLRAIKVLKSVSVIAAEDTRNSKKLLQHFDIQNKIISYHKFNEKSRVNDFLHKLKNGNDIAIISDAGTPGISDPAQIIIREAVKEKIRVETLPGATAFLPALVSSGFQTERFYFLGFLPFQKTEKENILKMIQEFRSYLGIIEDKLKNDPGSLKKEFQEAAKLREIL